MLKELKSDDLLMKRSARKTVWNRKFANNRTMKEWMKLHDDGSLASDRQLRIDLRLVDAEHLEAAQIIVKE